MMFDFSFPTRNVELILNWWWKLLLRRLDFFRMMSKRNKISNKIKKSSIEGRSYSIGRKRGSAKSERERENNNKKDIGRKPNKNKMKHQQEHERGREREQTKNKAPMATINK